MKVLKYCKVFNNLRAHWNVSEELLNMIEEFVCGSCVDDLRYTSFESKFD